jgi:uncharacterized membrane protein
MKKIDKDLQGITVGLTDAQVEQYIKDFQELLTLIRKASDDLQDIRNQMKESTKHTTK